jgi:DNA-binding response OmpR family regulator
MLQLVRGSELLRILIVEDDERLARGMEASMGAGGFVVDVVGCGEEALDVLAAETYNVVVLDLGLPDIDGLEVLRSLRRGGNATPVLILTARDAVSDRINGLDRGADDYLAKPFHPRELESRLRALIRRSQGTADPVLRVGHLSLDRSTRVVALGRSVVDLRRREMAVLETLMNRPGKVVTKQRLNSEVFAFADAVAPNALEVYVGRLRRKLMPDGPTIRTIRGLGYMLEA